MSHKPVFNLGVTTSPRDDHKISVEIGRGRGRGWEEPKRGKKLVINQSYDKEAETKN